MAPKKTKPTSPPKRQTRSQAKSKTSKKEQTKENKAPTETPTVLEETKNNLPGKRLTRAQAKSNQGEPSGKIDEEETTKVLPKTKQMQSKQNKIPTEAPTVLEETKNNLPGKRLTRAQAKSNQEEPSGKLDEGMATKVLPKTRHKQSKQNKILTEAPTILEETKNNLPGKRLTRAQAKRNLEEPSTKLDEGKTTKVEPKAKQRKTRDEVPSKAQKNLPEPVIKEPTTATKRTTRKDATSKDTHSKSTEKLEDVKTTKTAKKQRQGKPLKDSQPEALSNSTQDKSPEKVENQASIKKESSKQETSKIPKESKNSVDEIAEVTEESTESTSNNSENSDKQDKLLDYICEVAENIEEQPEDGITLDYLEQFLLNSRIKEMISIPLEDKSNKEILQHLKNVIFKLESIKMTQLCDLYHLAIIIQETTMSERHELLEIVCELTLEMSPEHIKTIGMSLCDRLIIGCGKQRMRNVINVLRPMVMLIYKSPANSQIAMITLLGTFAKVSGLEMPDELLDTDNIKNAFEMAKLVNWTHLVDSNRFADILVLVFCFALIINTEHNRSFFHDWHEELGSEIRTYFTDVLVTVRSSQNYNTFAHEIKHCMLLYDLL